MLAEAFVKQISLRDRDLTGLQEIRSLWLAPWHPARSTPVLWCIQMAK